MDTSPRSLRLALHWQTAEPHTNDRPIWARFEADRIIAEYSLETIVDVGPLHATTEREKTMRLRPVLGIATLAGGIVLVFAGVCRHA
jgi:hypothetical protein